GEEEHIILTRRVPWLAGSRASTRAAPSRLSFLVRCPSRAQRGAVLRPPRAQRDQRQPTTNAENVRETVRPHGECGRREREEASHVWGRSPGPLGLPRCGCGGQGGGHGRGEAGRAQAGWPTRGPYRWGGHARPPASVGGGFPGATPPSILWRGLSTKRRRRREHR